MSSKLQVYYKDLRKLCTFKRKKKNRFGATKSQIDSFLIRVKSHKLNKSLTGDALDAEVGTTLNLLSKFKID